MLISQTALCLLVNKNLKNNFLKKNCYPHLKNYAY
jgi:hypothetical protein